MSLFVSLQHHEHGHLMLYIADVFLKMLFVLNEEQNFKQFQLKRVSSVQSFDVLIRFHKLDVDLNNLSYSLMDLISYRLGNYGIGLFNNIQYVNILQLIWPILIQYHNTTYM